MSALPAADATATYSLERAPRYYRRRGARLDAVAVIRLTISLLHFRVYHRAAIAEDSAAFVEPHVVIFRHSRRAYAGGHYDDEAWRRALRLSP